MESAILSINKISRPRMADILPRERLFSLLDQAFSRSVVWISGPGGAGKSTLVASYLDSRNIPCIWYQVDEGDADIATLFYYLGLAATKAAPHIQQSLPLFTPEYQAGVAIFARRYFENLFSRLPPPYVLVLDDYHEVSAESAFHEVIKYALAEVPQGVTIVVASRQPTPATMARLCAGKQMSFVGWDELRLTIEETEGIVQLHDKNKDLQTDFRKLHDRIQGWVAGLVLFLERGKNEEVKHCREGKGTPEEIFNYFADELFDKTEARIREFLLITSLLPTITPHLAEKLTENADAARILAKLHSTNFFTNKLQDEEIHYRFHPLFREYLLNKTENTYDPTRLAPLKRTASLLLEESGRTEEAASLCIDAADWERLVELILGNAPILMAQGRSQTVLEWLERLPQSLLEQTPYLLFWYGVSNLSNNPVESRTRFKQAFKLFQAHGDRTGVFLSWCAVVDTAIHTSEYIPMREWTDVLKDILKEDPTFPAKDIEVRVALSLFNAIAFGLPNHPDICAIRERAFSLICTEKIADANLFLSSGLHLAINFIYQGDYTKGGIVLNLLQESIKSKETADLVLILVKTIEAHYSFATCALDTCISKAFEALSLAAKCGIHIWDMHIYGHALAAALAKGDEHLSGELVAKMSEGLVRCRHVDKGYYYWLMAWNAALRDSFTEACQFQELALKFASEIGFLVPEASILINMAEICLELGDDLKAAAFLEKALPLVQSIDSAYLYFCYFNAKSDFEFKHGSEVKGIESLRKSFSLGANCRIVNSYFWRPALMTRLCLKALEAGIEVEYVHELIKRRNLVPEEPPLHIENWPWPLKIYTLGCFELVKDDKPVSFSGKAQNKPLELLKALIAFGGKNVSEGRLTDVLWPDADGDMAQRSFDTTLHRLRKLIGNDKVLQLHAGRLSINPSYCWLDTRAFERQCGEVEDALSGKGQRKDKEKLALCFEKAADMYQGHFLHDDTEQPWTSSMREHMRSKFLHLLGSAGGHYEALKQWEKAAAWYRKGLQVDSLAEEFYQRLMVCKQQMGQTVKAVKTYQRCCSALSAGLDLPPSPKTEEIYAGLVKKR